MARVAPAPPGSRGALSSAFKALSDLPSRLGVFASHLASELCLFKAGQPLLLSDPLKVLRRLLQFLVELPEPHVGRLSLFRNLLDFLQKVSTFSNVEIKPAGQYL